MPGQKNNHRNSLLISMILQERKNENYFLGSIVLIKEDDKPHSEVIDGQQRLTTLSILISVIASALNPNRRDLCKDY